MKVLPESIKVNVQKIQWLKVYFWLSILIFFFMIGMVVGMAKLAPTVLAKNGAAAFTDWVLHFEHNSRLRPDQFMHRARFDLQGSGVTVYDRERAYPGVTFITSMWSDYRNGFNLIDMDGKVLHQWRVSYNQVWLDTPDFPKKKLHDWDIDIHGALLYPDGSVVFNFEYGGLVKIDKCSRVIWKLARVTNHSIQKDDDGNLWVSDKIVHEEPDEHVPILKDGIEEDLILKVSPDGKVIKEIPVLSAIYRSDLAGLVLGVKKADTENVVTDFGHLNSVDILSHHLAHQFPMFKVGDVLISLRHLNLIMVLDPETEKVKWWTMGSFVLQHDAQFLENGRIGLFDNRGRVENPLGASKLGSRILEIDPATKREMVRYESDDNNFFHTPIRGKQQFLPNDNILITEWSTGRAFEVDKQGRVVWSYLNRYDKDRVFTIQQASRFDVDYVQFPLSDASCQNL